MFTCINMTFNFEQQRDLAKSLVGKSIMEVNNTIFPEFPITKQYPNGTQIFNLFYNCSFFFTYDFNQIIIDVSIESPSKANLTVLVC
jgi:hypothetical protein